jgi:acyl carrier protein
MESRVIIEEIKTYLENNLLSADVNIDATTDLKQAGIDSFSTIEIILFIERKFAVVIPDDKLIPDNFRTLQALSSVVQSLLPV